MAKKEGIVYCRIDKDIKEKAEAIIKAGGYTPGNLISIFYDYIIENGRVPLALSIGPTKIEPDPRTDEEIRQEILKELESNNEEGTFTLEDLRKILNEDS